MKFDSLICLAVASAFAFGASAAVTGDYALLKTKTALLVDQAHGLYQDACRDKSSPQAVGYRYYCLLIHTAGTNLLARAESTDNERLMKSYLGLVEKDYDAYTKISAEEDMASATGSSRGKSGSRHRAKRLINAEKLRDRELAEAIKRWEGFLKKLNSGFRRR